MSKNGNGPMKTKLDAVTFEQMMSYRPLVGNILDGREPCIRDFVSRYYAEYLNIAETDKMTKRYIDDLHQKFGKQ